MFVLCETQSVVSVDKWINVGMCDGFLAGIQAIKPNKQL